MSQHSLSPKPSALSLAVVACAGKKKLKQSPLKDVWLHLVTFLLLTSSVACGVWQMVDGGRVISPLLISVAWAVYGNIAPTLVLWCSRPLSSLMH